MGPNNQKDANYYTFSRPEVRQYVPASAKTILDIGCGAGAVGAALKVADPSREVTGIEIVPEAAAKAAEKLDKVLVGDAQTQIEQLPDQYFDCIIAADVLEHLPNPEVVLKQIAGKCKPTGTLVASIPNVAHWSVLQGMLQGNWDYADAGLLDTTHLRFFTKKSVVSLLENSGFSVVLMTPVILGAAPIPAKFLQTMEEMGIGTRHFQEHAFDYQYLVVAKPVRTRPGATLKEVFGTEKKFSIIVLAYNQLEYTQKCVESIFQETAEPFELIFVDNGSSDGTGEYLRKLKDRDNRVKVITNPQNLGFGYACNQGILAAEGDYIVLVNNDIVLTPGWLTRMGAPFEVDPKIGIVGPRCNYTAGMQLVRGVLYGQDMGQMRTFAQEWSRINKGFGWDVTRVIGFCMAIKKEVVQAIGGFDTRFGIGNFEDDDYCLRALGAGFKIRVADDVFVHHYGSKSFGQLKVDYKEISARNWAKFKEKWGMDRGKPSETGYQPLELVKNGPLGGSLAVPLKFSGGTDSLEIEPSEKCRFLLWPDWFKGSDGWKEVVKSYLATFDSTDKVSMIIVADPALDVDTSQIEKEILLLASAGGKSPEVMPDMVLYHETLPADLGRLYRAADYFIPAGELEAALHAAEALDAGCQIVTKADQKALKEIYNGHNPGSMGL